VSKLPICPLSFLQITLNNWGVTSIIYRDTALEIWTDLRDTFSQGNGTKVFNIQKQIAEIHQGEQSLTNYFTQLKVL